MKFATKPSLTAILILFGLSFLVTGVFSASLKVFFAAESWTEVLVKGIVIPCFTWTVQLILSAVYLSAERRTLYWTQLGIVCLVGSVLLLPAAFYNFTFQHPSPWVSVVNVLSSVAIMAWCLYGRLRAYHFRPLWAVGWVVLIMINMSLYLWSIADAFRFGMPNS
ncbi:MAG TPA: hypothetical protein VF666_20405 [Pyrinomonadaceae bacterium]|jgi:hypothetical protein